MLPNSFSRFCLFFCLGAISGSPALAQVIYQQTFTDTGSSNLGLSSSTDWTAIQASTGQVDANIGDMISSSGYTAPNNGSGNVGSATPAVTLSQANVGGYVFLSSNEYSQLLYTNSTIISGITTNAPTFSFYIANANASNTWQVAVEEGGNWYVSTQKFSNGPAGNTTLPTQTQQSLTYNPASGNWNKLNVTGSGISVGTSAGALTGTSIQAFGLYYTSNSPANDRLDTFAVSQVTPGTTITNSMLDSTGTENTSTNPSSPLASNTVSKSFTVAANSDMIVVEVDIRDTGSSNPGMPATITWGSTTLNLAASQNSDGSSWHNVGIYYARLTPGASPVTATISGTFGTAGNLWCYALSAFSVSGENTALSPNTNAQDADSNATNSLTLGSVQAGDIAFVIAASGPGSGHVGLTLGASSGSVTTVTAANGATSPQGYPYNNYIMGYVKGLSAGTPTFTATQTSGDTGGKFVFAVADFDSSSVNTYPQRSSSQISTLLTPTRAAGAFYGGVPLGGIGTGTVEMRGDGSFREWQIFNNWDNGYTGNDGNEENFINNFAAVNINGTAHVLETSPANSLPGVSSVAYSGAFPFANISYSIPGSPVTVSSEGFGIYIPHDLQDSATPAIGLTYTFTNTTNQAVPVSFALSLVNPLGTDCTAHTAGNLTTTQCTYGTEGLAIESLDAVANSILGGADTNSTSSNFWSAFNQANPAVPTANEQGQRFGQMITFSVPANSTVSKRFVVGWNFPNHYEGGTGVFVGHQYSNWITDPQDAVDALATNFNTLRTNALTWAQTLQNSSWPAWLNNWLVNNQNTIAKLSWWTASTASIPAGHFMDYESSNLQNGSPIHITDLANWPVLDAFPSLDLELVTHFGQVQQSNGRIPEEFNSSNGPGITSPNFGRDLIDINPKWVMQVYHRWRETGSSTFLAANYQKAIASIMYQAPTSLGGLQDQDVQGEGIPNGTGPNFDSTWDHWTNAYTFSYGASVYLGGVLALQQMAIAEGDSATVTLTQNIYNKGLGSMNSLLWTGEFYAMSTDYTTSGNGTVTQTPDNLSHSEGIYGDDFTRQIGLGPVLPNDRSLSTLRAIAKYNAPPTPFGIVNSATTDIPDPNLPADSGSQNLPANTPAGTMVEYMGDVRDQITCCHDMPALISLMQQGNATDQTTALSLLANMYTISYRDIYGNLGSAPNYYGELWNLPHHVIASNGAENSSDFRHYLRDRALYATIKVLNGWVYNAPAQTLSIGPVLNPQNCWGPWSCSASYGTLTQTVANNGQTDTMTGQDVNGQLALTHLNVRSQVGTVSSVSATLNGSALSTSYTQSGNQVQIAFGQTMNLANAGSLVVKLGSSVPVGTQGSSYNYTFSSGGLSSPTFAVTSGSLPPGLTLSSTGVLSGNATQAGTYTATVTATDSQGTTSTQIVTLSILGGSTDTPTMPVWGLALLALLLMGLSARTLPRRSTV